MYYVTLLVIDYFSNNQSARHESARAHTYLFTLVNLKNYHLPPKKLD